MTRELSHEELYLFDTQGFVLKPSILDDFECKELEQKILTSKPDRWFDFAKADRWDDIVSKDKVFAKLAQKLAVTAKEVVNQPIRLIESYAMSYRTAGFLYMHNGLTQDKVYPDGTRATRNMAYRCDYHDGRLYATYVKALIYLSDVQSLADGPFCYVEGSHKANFTFPWPSDESGDPVLLSESRFPSLGHVYVCAGDMILLNDALLHGAARRKTVDGRLMMNFSFSPSFMADWIDLEMPHDLSALGYYGLDCEDVRFPRSGSSPQDGLTHASSDKRQTEPKTRDG